LRYLFYAANLKILIILCGVSNSPGIAGDAATQVKADLTRQPRLVEILNVIVPDDKI
jgi:hypothetical protein